MRFQSVSSARLSLVHDALASDEDYFNAVSGVNVSLSDRVDDVFSSIFNCLGVVGDFLHDVVVAHKLIVEKWSCHV
jgi:hypothetical protein